MEQKRLEGLLLFDNRGPCMACYHNGHHAGHGGKSHGDCVRINVSFRYEENKYSLALDALVLGVRKGLIAVKQ